MRVEFHDNIELSEFELSDLKEIVKVSHVAPWIYHSIDGLHASQSAKLCGVYANDSLASFAWHMQRTWFINGISFSGLSIGVLTTSPAYRNRGYAKKLILAITNLALHKEIDFLYLAGIPDFYDKFGFKGFAPKSKLVFKMSDLPSGEGTIESLTLGHLKAISEMHSAYSDSISAFLCRTNWQWEDLLGPLSSTFLFSHPKVILNNVGDPIAYFCSTPGDANVIREFVPIQDPQSVINALAIIANSEEHDDHEKLEIFAPAKGPVWDSAANSLGADFLCFLRPKASNMINWLSATKRANDFHCDFILQGDFL